MSLTTHCLPQEQSNTALLSVFFIQSYTFSSLRATWTLKRKAMRTWGVSPQNRHLILITFKPLDPIQFIGVGILAITTRYTRVLGML